MCPCCGRILDLKKKMTCTVFMLCVASIGCIFQTEKVLWGCYVAVSCKLAVWTLYPSFRVKPSPFGEVLINYFSILPC